MDSVSIIARVEVRLVLISAIYSEEENEIRVTCDVLTAANSGLQDDGTRHDVCCCWQEAHAITKRHDNMSRRGHRRVQPW